MTTPERISRQLEQIQTTIQVRDPVDPDLYFGQRGPAPFLFMGATDRRIDISAAASIAPYSTVHSVETQGGGATGKIDVIKGGVNGQLLFLYCYVSSRLITVTHQATGGNIFIRDGQNFIMSGTACICLRKQGADWVEIWRIPYRIAATLAQSADFTVANTTWTSIPFPLEVEDTANLHNTTINNSRITFPVGGKYHVGFSAHWGVNATGHRACRVYLNNGSAILADRGVAVSGTTSVNAAHRTYSFITGDYIELQAYQDSGGNLDVLASGVLSPHFWVERIFGDQ